MTESHYSVYREDISNNLEWVIYLAIKQFDETNNHVWLNIILKAQETKMKHTSGENINISTALLGKKLNQLKEELGNKNKKLEDSSLNDQEECMIDIIDICKQQQTRIES